MEWKSSLVGVFSFALPWRILRSEYGEPPARSAESFVSFSRAAGFDHRRLLGWSSHIRNAG